LLFKAVDAKLPNNALGWDTGTVEILKPIEVSIDPEHQASFMLKEKALVVSTTDSTEKIASSVGEGDNHNITWDVDTVRLPVYNRYSTSLTFDMGAKGGFGPTKGKPSAIAVLWLQDIPDDEEIPVKLPILVSKDIRQLRQNYVDEATKIGHDFKTVGWLTTTVRVDRGLDPVRVPFCGLDVRKLTCL
jgi:hypothetical protein